MAEASAIPKAFLLNMLGTNNKEYFIMRLSYEEYVKLMTTNYLEGLETFKAISKNE